VKLRAGILFSLLLSPHLSMAQECGRPFAGSTLQATGRFATSPLRASWADLLWMAPAGLAIAATLNNDLALNQALAKGEARKEWLDHSMPAASALGDGLIEFAGAALASRYGDERMKRTSAVAMQALVVSAIWAQAFKFAAWSNRPYINDQSHKFFDYSQDSTGFPSGHSFSAFAVAEVYGDEYGRWISYPLAALVAYSRVYVQDHWPSDVVAGSILGVVVGVQARRQAAAEGPPLIRFSVRPSGPTPLLVADVRY
jgi:membrane-associated phospholipid phosphatase